MAGAVMASLLARKQIAVTLVDPRPQFPPLFRAEKIEPDQADLLRKLGLFDVVEPVIAPIREIWRADRGRVHFRRPIEQYGMRYHDMVNAVRNALPGNVDFHLGTVDQVVADAERPRVRLATGEEMSPRLVVLASGTTAELARSLGVEREPVTKGISLAFGFDLRRPDGAPFPFDAVTYHPDSMRSRVGYLTLFRTRETLRANLFVYWPAQDEETRTFTKNPGTTLDRLLPGLRRVIGDYEISSRIETCRIDLYRVDAPVRPGLILAADAGQSVCPTTGMGLSKVLTDADVLCHDCIPGWLATPGMGEEKVGQFYAMARKRETDAEAWSAAWRGRELATGTSLKNRARRIYRRWRWCRGL